MSATKRRRLWIEVFGAGSQQARVLPTLTPPQLVTAIIEEFQELEYLSAATADYQLVRPADQTPLDDAIPIGQQLADDEQLVLVEKERPLPAGAQRPSQPVYLREQGGDRVYKLHWTPAIIGRHDPSQPYNERVAVNLDHHRAGLRVSRRHLQIVEEGSQYKIQNLAVRNPALLRDLANNTQAITAEPRRLQHGDTIILERSDISLRFIVRSEPSPVELMAEPVAEAALDAPAAAVEEENR